MTSLKRLFQASLLLFLLNSFAQTTEICGNGLDDDGDGYIDSYDEDCADVPTCTAVPNIDAFAVVKKEESLPLYSNGSTPTVGDIDGDGVVEIIVARANHTNLGFDIFEGNDLSVPPIGITLDTHIASSRTSTQVAIADLDKDGTAEIIALGRDNHVYVFSHTGGNSTTYELKSNLPTGYTNTTSGIDVRGSVSPRVVDINEDGIPEIVVGRAIFQINASYTSLTRVVAGVDNLPGGRNIFWDRDIVVKDVIASNPGKELIAGGAIYRVDLVAGTLTLLKNVINATKPAGSVFPATFAYIDGPAAVADMDLDGDIDIVIAGQVGITSGGGISSKRFFIIWDPNNGTNGNILLFEEGTGYQQGIPFIANVYDDTQDGKAMDFPEAVTIQRDGVASPIEGYVVAHNLNYPENVNTTSQNNTFVWRFSHDDASALTTLNAFDFNGDGIKEMVYRDTNQMRIMNGNVNPPVNYIQFPAYSATWTEGPVIADVDGDNQAEIVTVSGSLDADYSANTFTNGTNRNLTGTVQIFEAGVAGGQQTTWQNARPLWNQRGYSYVNINDDLTVPATEQSHLVEFPSASGRHDLNIYMAQLNPDAFFLPPLSVPVPDALITITSIGTASNGDFILNYTVTNNGSATLSSGTPISIYLTTNPTSSSTSTYLDSFTLPVSVVKDGSYSGSVEVTADDSQAQMFYMVVNDDGSQTPIIDVNDFPNNSGIYECNYANNLSNLQSTFCYKDANLAAATSTEVGISTLNRRENISSIQWPANVKSAILALDSKEKGFVITRLEDPENDVTTPVEGMLVYDTDDFCLKMYDGSNWFCLVQKCID